MSGVRGRPREAAIGAAIGEAAAELLVERGFSNVTVDAIVSRARTSKPAFYRRFSGIADVVPAILTSRYGLDADIDEGSFVADLLLMQERQLAMFCDPLIPRGVVGFLEQAQHDPAQANTFRERFLWPRREVLRRVIARAVSRREADPATDSEWIGDLITGPFLMRAIIPGVPAPGEDLVRLTVHAALDASGYAGDRSAVDWWHARTEVRSRK